MKFNRASLYLLLLILCGMTCGGLWFWWNGWHNSGLSYLPHRQPAEWIVYASPFLASERPRIELETRFRREFVLKDAPAKAEISWSGFTRSSLAVNDVGVGGPEGPGGDWKKPRRVEVAKFLHAGTNRIEVTVYNEAGPPGLWLSLRGDGVEISSDASWEASYAGAVWARARRAEEPAPIMKGSPVYGGERSWSSLGARWRALLLFAVLSGGLLAGGWWGYKWMKASPQTFGSGLFTDPAAGCLAVLMLSWILLLSHNAALLPRTIGFDADGHMKYVDYIQERGRLPLANEGQTMYNPPFYYLAAAGVLSACGWRTADVGGVVALRYLGLVIGLVQLLLVFGSLRLIFPKQTGRQVSGLVLAGFLPAQLYLSHYVTNEVLAGVMVTATLYTCLRALRDEQPSPKRFAAVGGVLGLALLTKFTAVLVVPFVAAALVLSLVERGVRDWRIWFQTTGAAVLTCLVVCGWHYARVWAHFGKPLVGNWEASSGQFGWQDPGYRTAAYFLGFGESLSNPLFSGQASFSDAVYSTLWGDGYCGGVSGLVVRTPWNYHLMAVGYLLALAPTVLIGLGAFISLRRLILRPTSEGVLLNGLAWAFVAALVHMALKFPTYALVKAFYGLLILLPVCAFGAQGWDFLARRGRFFWVSVSIALGTWALCAFGSFWISSGAAQTNLLLGVNLAIDGKQEQAVERLSAALTAEPTNFLAKSLLADSLAGLGQRTAAERLRKELCETHAGSAECERSLAMTLEKQGRLAEAAEHTRRAVEASLEDAQSYGQLASRLMKLDQTSRAIAVCREGLRIAPTDWGLHLLLGMDLLHDGLPAKPVDASAFQDGTAFKSSKDTEEAFHHLRLACQLGADSWQTLNGLAWVLATYPEARWRNGVEAVRLAEQACHLTDNRLPGVLGTLAVAYAEAGRFPDAISAVQRAKALARELEQPQLSDLHEEWLRLFNAGRAYREPPIVSGGKTNSGNSVTP